MKGVAATASAGISQHKRIRPSEVPSKSAFPLDDAVLARSAQAKNNDKHLEQAAREPGRLGPVQIG